MPDSVETQPGQQDLSTPSTFPELAVQVVRDGVIGAIAGAAGNVAVLGTLLVAAALGGFSLEAFTRFPALLGFDAFLTPDQLLAVGVGSFIIGGMTVWPLFLATIGALLPGETYAARGVVFGAVIWTGFATYFHGDVTGSGLVIYAVFSLLGHMGYGFVTGAVMDRLFGDRPPLVTAALTAPDE
jgi:hypothetical protein